MHCLFNTASPVWSPWRKSPTCCGNGRFWTCYLWRQGVREGELGFLISLMAGLDAVLSGLRAREHVICLFAHAAADVAAE